MEISPEGVGKLRARVSLSRLYASKITGVVYAPLKKSRRQESSFRRYFQPWQNTFVIILKGVT